MEKNKSEADAVANSHPTSFDINTKTNPTSSLHNGNDDGNVNGSGIISKTGGKESNVAALTPAPTPAQPPSLEDSRTRLQTFVIMASLCATLFLAALDITIVTTALPTIAGHFHSNAGYTWIGSAYLLANTATTPSWGRSPISRVESQFCCLRWRCSLSGVFWLQQVLVFPC